MTTKKPSDRQMLDWLEAKQATLSDDSQRSTWALEWGFGMRSVVRGRTVRSTIAAAMKAEGKKK
jgi:hypothetical protein